jgi:5-methylcytosine-specific restriction protein A
LIKEFPDWKWPTYPKMYTTVNEGFANRLLELCGDRTVPDLYDIDGEVVTEGKVFLARHLVRERDLSIIQAKREQCLAMTGRLRCEVCSFDFLESYGELGRNFCEVHHLLPMADRHVEAETRLQDLAVVCSNCHRMLHRDGLRTVQELRDVIQLANP